MKSVKSVNVLLIAAALPILAGAATNRYIVDLSTEPAARFASRNFGEHKESLARPEVQAHRTKIRTEQDTIAASIRALGGVVLSRTDTASNTITISIPDEKAAGLSAIAGVKAYHAVRHYRAMLDQAAIVHNLPQVYSQVGGMSNAGAGIKIAMIDSGIDITQPAFSDAGFQAPPGFPLVNATSDTKYTNNKVIVARAYPTLWTNPNDPDPSASDEIGHGTSTADCAAGVAFAANSLSINLGNNFGLPDLPNIVTPTLAGAAPGAYLGSYKVFDSSSADGATDTAILQAVDDAVNDGMDIINYSLGSFPPIPAALDDVAQAMNNAVSSGVIVAAAAGNDGNGIDPSNSLFNFVSADFNGYIIPEMVSSEGAMNVIQVGASSNARGFGPMLTVGNSQFMVDTEYAITTDINDNPLVYSGAPIIDVTTLDNTGDACNSLPARSLAGAIALISMANYDPIDDTCDPDQKMDNALAAGAIAGIIYDDVPEGFWDIGNVYSTYYQVQLLDSTNLPGGFITYEDGAAILSQLSSNKGSTATMDFNFQAVPLNSNRVAFLSSRGPNADFEIKPDLVAVGQDLLTAAETINQNGDYYDPTGLLYPANGTSGATPLVAGTAAILKAARPGLTVLDYRSLIINSAATVGDPINGGLARVMDTGAGLLDANAALNAEVTVVPASLSFGLGPVLSKSITVKNIGVAQDTFALTVNPRDVGFPTPQLDQTSLTLAPGASATVNVTMPSGLQSGEYEGSIQILGSNTPTNTHVMYWLGVPSSTPYFIVDMGYDEIFSFTPGQVNTAAIAFRVTDAAGIYMTNILSQVNIQYNGTYSQTTGRKVNGNQSTSTPYYLTDTTNFEYSPGVIAIDVKPSSAANVYDEYIITIGNPNTSNLSLYFDIFGGQ